MHYNDIPFDFDSLNIRKSVYDMQVMTLDNPYPGELPKELEKFHYYFAMDGHVLMVIPRNYLQKALETGDLDDYEIQIPVKIRSRKRLRICRRPPQLHRREFRLRRRASESRRSDGILRTLNGITGTSEIAEHTAEKAAPAAFLLRRAPYGRKSVSA